MIRLPLAAVLCVAILPGATRAQAPSLTPPPPPAVDALVELPALDLASGYLAARSALPVADLARQGQGILTLGLDGVHYRVDATNGDQFIALLHQRIAAFGEAIETRGSSLQEGQYGLAASTGCAGEKFDPRYTFATRGRDGAPVMATGGRIARNGPEVDFLATISQGRASVSVILAGAAVDDAIVFSNAMGEGFSLYGTIEGDVIMLGYRPEEAKAALGADAGTQADWTALADCAFTLTRK